jgi:ABC-type glycerol-3-phosphate transport system permease component
MPHASLRGGRYLGLLLFLAAALFPFYWMLATSLKAPNEMLSVPPTYVPRAPSLEPYIHLFAQRHFGEYTVNSFIVAAASTLLSTSLAALAAYAFARFKFPGKAALMGSVLLTAMLPFISVLGPTYLMIKTFGLLNTKTGLTAVYVAGGIPFAIWFLFVFFQSIPIELEEAARVDGCNRLQTFLRITLPLSGPGLVTTVIFLFIWFWNEFIFALVLTLSPVAKTITVGITELPGIWEIPYDYMSAAGTIAALPVVLLVLLFQRYIVQGMVAGAVKG